MLVAGLITIPKDGYLYKEIRDITDLKLTAEYDINEAGQVIATKNPRGFTTTLVVNELEQTIETISPGPAYRSINFFNGNNLLERRER